MKVKTMKLDPANLMEMLEKLTDNGGERPKRFVGNISDEVIRMFREKARMEERIEQEMDLRKKQYELEITRKLEDEFQDKVDEIERKHDEVWSRIYKELNVDPLQSYTIKLSKKAVYEYVDEKQEAKPFGVVTKFPVQ